MFSEAFGMSSTSRAQVQLWLNWFKVGRDDVITDGNIEEVKKYNFAAENVGISFGLCLKILTIILDMKLATAKILLKLINFE